MIELPHITPGPPKVAFRPSPLPEIAGTRDRCSRIFTFSSEMFRHAAVSAVLSSYTSRSTNTRR